MKTRTQKSLSPRQVYIRDLLALFGRSRQDQADALDTSKPALQGYINKAIIPSHMFMVFLAKCRSEKVSLNISVFSMDGANDEKALRAMRGVYFEEIHHG